MIYHFDILASTNDEAAKPTYGEGDIIWADQQSAGRGQRGHKWESRKGENITFSAIFEPRFVPILRQFLLSQAVALGVVDALRYYGIVAKIKWTNDIYVGDRKLAGILIEHKLQGNEIGRTIAGIGLNVNQMEFSPDLPNPVSMRQLTRVELDTEEVLRRVVEAVMARYEMLRQGGEQQIQEDYHEVLYRRDALHWYFLPSGERFRGTIRGVEPSGALRVENEKGEERSYQFKEIEFSVKNITKFTED